MSKKIFWVSGFFSVEWIEVGWRATKVTVVVVADFVYAREAYENFRTKLDERISRNNSFYILFI